MGFRFVVPAGWDISGFFVQKLQSGLIAAYEVDWITQFLFLPVNLEIIKIILGC